MAKIQDIDIPYLEFAEAAAPGTGASAITRIYTKADGLMYSKDDAGTETLMSSGPAAGGVSSGTSFPGGPANNDLFYRTDLDLLFFYNGTYWLTVTEYEFHLPHVGTAGVTADSNSAYFFPITADGTIYLTKYYATTYVSATAIWTVDLYYVTVSSLAETLISSALSTSGDAATTAVRHETDLNALVPNGAFMLRLTFNETTGSATFVGAASIRYRRRAT